MTKLTDLGSCFMLMETYMKEIGKTIRPMEKAHIHTRMVPDIKVTGKMINSTGSGQKHGPTVLSTKGNTPKAKRMAKGS